MIRTPRSWRVGAMVMFLCFSGALLADQKGFEEGFEQGAGPFEPAAWKGAGKGQITDGVAHSGKRSFELTGGQNKDDVTVLWWSEPPMRLLAGQEYVVSVWIRTDNAGGVELRVSLPKDVRAEGLKTDPLKGTNDWKKIEQRFKVSDPVQPRYFAVWLQGPGKAWIDDFTIEGKLSEPDWGKTVEVDPAGIKTDKEFLAALAKQGLTTRGYVNWYTGRWPNISFIGGMAMGNNSEDLEFFYEKPFKWWSEVLDYVMQDGGRKYGIRARVHRYKEQGKVPGHRSFLLTVRTDTLLADYHPSYILAGGRRVWDSKVHPCQAGKIVVPFWQEEAGDPVIDFVVDLDHTPKVKGLAFRMFFVEYLGEPGAKASLKGASDKKEASPADSLEKFPFGVFSSAYDFWTDKGEKLQDLKKAWKHNFRPGYPVDEVFLSPHVFAGAGKGEYHDFMLTYGGCNVAGNDPDPAILKEGETYIRAVLVKAKDAKVTKAFLDGSPGLEAHWFDGEYGTLVAHGGVNEAARAQQMDSARKAIDSAKQASGSPQRVRYVYEPFPPALTAAHEYERGVDILVLKNEEDPQYNIMMSMARGAGRSFGKPFGFYWEQTHYPFVGSEFKLQACLLYYLSGGSWIGAEAEQAPSFSKGIVADWVLPFVKAQRFAMVHPARGTPVVPVGILWTYGDRWWAPYNPLGQMDTFQRHIEYDHATRTLKCEPAFTKVLPWMPQDRAKWNFQTVGHLGYFIDHVPELKGYDLLDVFFPQYGDAFTARISRLLTGTPYGPADFVYGDKASGEMLKSYGLIAILGHANMSKELEAKLTAAAEAGAHVVLGAQHFKGADGSLMSSLGLQIQGPAAALKGQVAGVLFDKTAATFDATAYAAKYAPQSALPGEWETVASVGDRAIVVRKAVGKGAIYVYLGEWVHQGAAALRPILAELARQAAPLHFAPLNDRVEYVAYRKGAGAWVALFNHDNIPVGCDRLKELRATPPEPLVSKPNGPYKGEVQFRLDRLRLDPKGEFSLYEVEGIDGAAFDDVISGNKTFQVKEIPAELKDGVLRAKVEVRTRAQFVIAPKGQGEVVFFGKP